MSLTINVNTQRNNWVVLSEAQLKELIKAGLPEKLRNLVEIEFQGDERHEYEVVLRWTTRESTTEELS